jgi:hypothetical protein
LIINFSKWPPKRPGPRLRDGAPKIRRAVRKRRAKPFWALIINFSKWPPNGQGPVSHNVQTEPAQPVIFTHICYDNDPVVFLKYRVIFEVEIAFYY